MHKGPGVFLRFKVAWVEVQWRGGQKDAGAVGKNSRKGRGFGKSRP